MITVSHLDKWIEDMYQSEQSLGKLITIASFVALLIAIIGIIGLVFFETQFLRKEIAVRRVNGATVGSILQMINKKYLVMAGISFLLAAPVAYCLPIRLLCRYGSSSWRCSPLLPLPWPSLRSRAGERRVPTLSNH